MMAKIVRSNQLTHENEIRIKITGSANEFIRSKETSTRSPYTVTYYRKTWKRISEWIQNEGLSYWDEITPDLIRQFLESLKSEGHNQGGIHAYYRSLRSLMNWVWDEYDIQNRNPIKKVKCSDRRPEPIPGITIQEVSLLLKAIKEASRFPERDTAILYVLIDTGIRRSELISLEMRDVDLALNQLTIRHGKGDKSRQVFFGNDCKKQIKKYLSKLDDISPTDPLWLTYTNESLTLSGVREIIRRIQSRAGLETYYSFHDFRRCFAIERKRNGDDDITISRALGHSSLEVTKRYLAFTPEDDRAFALRASPMDNRRK